MLELVSCQTYSKNGLRESGQKRYFKLIRFSIVGQSCTRFMTWAMKKNQGRFYEKELQHVALPEFHNVDKVIGKRGSGSKAEVLVSWKGYPSKFKSLMKAMYPYIKGGFSALTGKLLKGGFGLLEDTVRQIPIRTSTTNRVQTF
ncbi:hypothetical protein B566_EDAN013036 [Ephemera danica]|nr:hypothetical protein B566_EDAN013036 [Ephemera danica]